MEGEPYEIGYMDVWAIQRLLGALRDATGVAATLLELDPAHPPPAGCGVGAACPAPLAELCGCGEPWEREHSSPSELFEARCPLGLRGIGLSLPCPQGRAGTLFVGPFLYQDERADSTLRSDSPAFPHASPHLPADAFAAVPRLPPERADRLREFYEALVRLASEGRREDRSPGPSGKDRPTAADSARPPEPHVLELLENVRLAAVILDLDARVTYCNPHLADLLGWRREEILGRNWFADFLPHDARRAVEQVYRDAVRSAEIPLQYENEILSRSGQRRLVAWSNTVLHDAGGTVVGVTAIGQDITEHRKAHEDLRGNKTRLKRAQELAHVGNWELDLETGTIWASEEAFRIYGLPRVSEHLPLAQAQRLVHPEDRPRMDEALRLLAQEGRGYDEEFRIRRAYDGEERVIHSRADLERDVNGRPRLLLGVLQDITERRRAEQGRQRLEAQVLQAQKLESLGVLAGGIAHDFNNLLVSILGNADLGQMKLDPGSPALDNFREIEKASLRAAELCRQMLAYSGRGRFEIRPLDLSGLVQEMKSLVGVSVSKKITLVSRLADDLPAAEADATQIRQIVLNLLTNASEAIGDAVGTITVSTGLQMCDRTYLAQCHAPGDALPGPYVYLDVSDTGCGMDAETRARLFDPFFTTKFTGRGLGLAAVLGIVRSHAGAIRVESEPGRGTAIRVLLPATERKPAPVTADEHGLPIRPRAGIILLVDDEASIRDVGTKMLESLGFRVRTAADGREALQVLAELHDAACIVLDLTMPGMDGEETLGELRRRGIRLPILLSSGYSRHELAERFTDGQVAGFLQKPFRSAELAAALQRALGSDA